MGEIDETHGPGLRCRVESAQAAMTDFPIQNLPPGVFRDGARSRIGTAIGDELLDLHACAEAGLLPPALSDLCRAESLNLLMAGPAALRRELRLAVSRLLRADGAPLPAGALLRQAEVEMRLPAIIGDYTDF